MNYKLLLFYFIVVICFSASLQGKPKFSESFSLLIKEKFNEKGELPLILFPHSKNSLLKNLRVTLKEKYYEPVEKVDLTLPSKAKSGKFTLFLPTLSCTFHGFMIKNFPFSKVLLEFKDLLLDKPMLDKGNLKIEKCSEIILNLAIKLSLFSEFVRKETSKFGIITPEIKSLENGSLHLTGQMKLMDYNGEVNIEGVFEISEKEEILFKILKCNAGGVSIPGFIVDSIAQMLNPVVKVEELPFGLKPFKVGIEGENIFLEFHSEKFSRKVHQIEFKSSLIREKLNK